MIDKTDTGGYINSERFLKKGPMIAVAVLSYQEQQVTAELAVPPMD